MHKEERNLTTRTLSGDVVSAKLEVPVFDTLEEALAEYGPEKVLAVLQAETERRMILRARLELYHRE